MKKKLEERARYQERLEAEANKAYMAFLTEIMDGHYVVLRNVVNKLAMVDCLFGLAEVASQGDYVKPTFVESEDDLLEIQEGRHPMIELLRNDPFVPNTVSIGGTDSRTKIITGPNMGGKSSTVIISISYLTLSTDQLLFADSDDRSHSSYGSNRCLCTCSRCKIEPFRCHSDEDGWYVY